MCLNSMWSKTQCGAVAIAFHPYLDMAESEMKTGKLQKAFFILERCALGYNFCDRSTAMFIGIWIIIQFSCRLIWLKTRTTK